MNSDPTSVCLYYYRQILGGIEDQKMHSTTNAAHPRQKGIRILPEKGLNHSHLPKLFPGEVLMPVKSAVQGIWAR
jgi:hypothetical protein